MDLGVTMITIIIIAICSLPFISIWVARMKHKKQLLNSLSAIAGQQNCHITQHDFIGNTVLGMDESKNYLFFLKEKSKNLFKEQSIDLTEVKKCDVIKTAPNKRNEIKKLEIGFEPKRQNQSIQSLVFFNYDEDFQLSDELEKMKKWTDLINKRI